MRDFRIAGMLFLASALALHAEPPAPSPSPGKAKIHLDIVATGFIKARLEPKTRFYSQGRKRQLGGMGPLAGRVESLLKESQEKGHSTVLVDLGSHLSGSVLAQKTQGAVMVELMNHLPYAGALVTNFEFSFGPAALGQRAAEAKYPYIASNLKFADETLAKMIVPEVTVDAGPIKVGILGLTPERLKEISSKDATEGVEVVPGLAPVLERAERMKSKEKVDVVVLLTKLSIDESEKSVIEAFAGSKVDVVLGIDYERDGTDIVAWGTTYATGIPGHNRGSRVKVVELTLDPETRKLEKPEAYVVSVNAGEQNPHPAVEARLVELRKQHPELGKVMGSVEKPLPHRWKGESLMANVVTDAMREAAKSDLAYVNSGAVQAGLEPGEITLDDIFEVLPWENQILTLDVTGEELVKLVQDGVPQQFIYHPSGFRFEVTEGAGGRVEKVEVFVGKDPVDPKKTFKVAVTDFSVQRVPLLAGRKTEPVGQLREMLIDHITKHSPIRAEREKRDVYHSASP